MVYSSRMPEPTVTKMSWDWKSRPSHEELTAALKPFGLTVYADPYWEGSDQFAYIISNQTLSPEELKAHAESDEDEE